MANPTTHKGPGSITHSGPGDRPGLEDVKKRAEDIMEKLGKRQDPEDLLKIVFELESIASVGWSFTSNPSREKIKRLIRALTSRDGIRLYQIDDPKFQDLRIDAQIRITREILPIILNATASVSDEVTLITQEKGFRKPSEGPGYD